MIIQITDSQIFKQKALLWAAAFGSACYLDSNGFNDNYSKFDTLIAAGVKDEIIANSGDAFEQLSVFRKNNPGWVIGFLGYDLKNEIERLSSNNTDNLHFPDLYFFVPQYIITLKSNKAEIIADDAEAILKAIEKQVIPSAKTLLSL